MPFQEISSPSLRKLFVQQLEGLILSGELRPGDRLPTERELADEMKISKTVVHEGLRELHQLGFLQVESRKGVTVADYAQTGSLETLMAIMDYHGGLPDKKTASSILDLRYYLEAPALRQLAARHTPGDLAALRALQQKAEEASLSGVGPLAEALLRYHRGSPSSAAIPSLPSSSMPLPGSIWNSGPTMSVWKALPAACTPFPASPSSSKPGKAMPPLSCCGKDWSASGPRSANSFFLRLAHTWYSIILFPRFSAR